jgi:P4 family phage/plasmid primase-like protien
MQSLIDRLKAHPDFSARAYYERALPSLKTAGNAKAMALCPFHADTDPSLSIDLSTGKWTCFGACKTHGDILDFEAKRQGRSVDKQWIGEMAERYQIERDPPRKGPPPAKKTVAPFSLETFAEKKGISTAAFKAFRAVYVRQDEAVCIPMFSTKSKKLTGWRRRFAKGKPRTNKGGKLGLFIPSDFDFSGTTLFTAEGETDSAAGYDLGLRTLLGLPGGGNPEMIGDVVEGLSAQPALVILADHDTAGAAHARRIAFATKKRCPDRSIKIWHPLKAGADLRDWKADGGTPDRLLAEVAKLPEFKADYEPECLKADAEGREPWASELARDFLHIRRYLPEHDFLSLRYYKGEFFDYGENGWTLCEHEDLAGELWGFGEPHWIRGGPTKGKVSNVIAGLQAEIPALRGREMPMWLDKRTDDPARFILVKNGLLDLDTYTLSEPTPYFFSCSALSVNYQADAECPKWLGFLREIFLDNESEIRVLQEFFGYTFLPDQRYQSFLLLYGAGNNGKTQVLDVLRGLIGQRNCSNIGLDLFGQRFALHSLIAKMANISGDVPELDNVAEGYLKQITGGDPVTIDRKHIKPIEVHIGAKLIFACNNYPRFHDRSRGLWRRMIILPFEYQVDPAKKIPDIGRAIVAEEGSGILNWALEGLQRLLAQHHFTLCGIADTEKSKLQLECNPADNYLREHVVPHSESTILGTTLYARYSEWCKLNGNRPLNSGHFGRQVRFLFPMVKQIFITDPLTGKRARSHEGIAFRETLPESEVTEPDLFNSPSPRDPEWSDI